MRWPDKLKHMTQQLFEEHEIPVSELERVGLAKNGRISLKEEDLTALLSGSRTGMLRLENFEQDDIRIMKMDAKLSLRENGQGTIELIIHPVYREVDAPSCLTAAEAEALEKGEAVNIEKSFFDEKGYFKDLLVEFDPETNEFIITDTDRIIAPDFVNNEKLTAEQKERYRKGKEVKLEDGTTFQFAGTDPKGIRSNKLALIASILVDGGLSYMLYKGLHALAGQKHDKVSEDYSRGYFHALEDMQGQQVKDRMKGQNVYSR
jgi:hypothetical protein